VQEKKQLKLKLHIEREFFLIRNSNFKQKEIEKYGNAYKGLQEIWFP